MSEKKIVGRNVAIALGIIAIILLVGLVGAIANYTSIINGKDNTITTKDSQIQTLTNQKNQLQTWLDGNKTLLNQTQTWLNGNLTLINTLNAQITNLQDQIDSLNQTYLDYISTHSHSDSEYNTLQSAYNDYIASHSHTNSEYDSLQSDYNNYVATHHHTDSEYDALKSDIDALKAPKLIQVHLMSDDVRHVYPWDPDHHLHVYGYVCNVGTNTAYSSKIHVVAYQSGGVVAIDTYITLGTINGESWTSKDSSIYYSGSELVSWTLTLEWTA